MLPFDEVIRLSVDKFYRHLCGGEQGLKEAMNALSFSAAPAASLTILLTFSCLPT